MTYSGKGVWHCDECPEHIDTGESDFDEGRRILKEKGWRTFKGPDDLWAQACPSCTEAWAKEQRR